VGDEMSPAVFFHEMVKRREEKKLSRGREEENEKIW